MRKDVRYSMFQKYKIGLIILQYSGFQHNLYSTSQYLKKSPTIFCGASISNKKIITNEQAFIYFHSFLLTT